MHLVAPVQREEAKREKAKREKAKKKEAKTKCHDLGREHGIEAGKSHWKCLKLGRGRRVAWEECCAT